MTPLPPDSARRRTFCEDGARQFHARFVRYHVKDTTLRRFALVFGFAALVLAGCSDSVEASSGAQRPALSVDEQFKQRLLEGGFDVSVYLSAYVNTAKANCHDIAAIPIADDQKFMVLANIMGAKGANRRGYESAASIRNLLSSALKTYCPEFNYLIPAPDELFAPGVTAEMLFGQVLTLSGIPVADDLDRVVAVAKGTCELWSGVNDVPAVERYNRLLTFTTGLGAQSPVPSLEVLSDPAKADMFLRSSIMFYCPQYTPFVPTG